jgi:hypothetical protein
MSEENGVVDKLQKWDVVIFLDFIFVHSCQQNFEVIPLRWSML